MESGIITITGLDERIRRVEVGQARTDVDVTAVKDDVKQINERLDRAAKAGYFVGTALLMFSATILGALLVPH